MKWATQGRFLKKIFMITALATTLLASSHLKAGDYDMKDPRQIAMLPPYCKYTQGIRTIVEGGNDVAKIKQWESIIGEAIFSHMHHWCIGLMNINYAKFYARDARERLFQLDQSVGQIQYVIQRSQPGEKLLPEFLTRQGESLIALNRIQEAIAVFQRAIQLKPDYWPPYAALSDYYKDIGSIKMAREILEQGLSSSPDAKALTRRLAELDAAKDKPKAAPQARREAVAPKQPAKESAPQPAPQTETPQSPAEH